MKHPLTASFAIVLIAVLLISGLPGAQLPGRSAAAAPQANTPDRSVASPTLLAPTGYDRLHHASPSTPWTVFTGRGVNAVLGNLVQQAQDLAVPGRGLPLAFTRTYNSASTSDGPLGPGWTHSYNLAVIPDGADAVLLQGADGRLDRFLRQADGSYVAPTGIHSQLTAAADGTYALRTKSQTVYRFDASGRLVSITDRNANAILLEYGGGDLTGITDTVGRTFVLLYDGLHHLTELRDPTGRTVRFTYHPDGRLASVIDPLGHVTSYGYTGGYLTSITDANGHTLVSNTYDAQGRVTEQRDALGNATTFTYDWNSGQTTVTGPRGDATVYTADAGYRVTAVRDAAGYTTTTAYDAANNRISLTDRRGATSSFAYDALGNLIQATDAAGGFSFYTYDTQNNLIESQDALGRLTTFTYDARGNRLTATDPLDQTTTYGYDSHGQIISTTDAGGRTTAHTYDAQGNMTAETDALGQTTSFGYDALGRMTSRTDPADAVTGYHYDANDRLVEVTDAAGHTTSSTYDAIGNRTAATDQNGHSTDYAYDAANRLTQITDAAGGITRYTYDADGNRITMTDATNATTASEYDLLDRLVKVTDPLGNATRYGYDPNGNRTAITDTLGQVTSFTYDTLNRVIATTDPLDETTSTAYDAVGNANSRTDARGNITHYEYDALNRLVAVTDAVGGTVRYYYDAAGNRTAIVDAKGSAAASAATAAGSPAVESQAGAAQYIYDAANRLAEVVDPLGNRTRYTYDAAGNLMSKTDANGLATTYEYDALGRLVKALYPDNTITYHYDAAGNRTHVIDIQGVTLYEYDALNRVVRVTDPAGQAVGYAYDALGRRTQLTYPDGQAVSYIYDARGRMATVTDWDANATGYTYDARGQLSRVAYPNGTSIEYGYDDAGHLTDIVHRDAGGQILLPIHYDLDANGNRVAMTDNRGTENYTYDDLDRLAQVAYADGETVSYTYDEAGNRLTMESSLHGLTAYEYNVADQLLRMTAPDSTVTDFAYDANGNMIRKGSVEHLFDGANRLTQVIDGENWVAFTYDGDGHRLSKTSSQTGGEGQTTTYATDVVAPLPQVLAEVRGGQAISYTYGLALNSIAEPGEGWRYYHADGLGSVRALSDEGGATAASYSYDAFGALRGQSGTMGNAFTYTGQQFDAETGLLYLRARYYDLETGRFISRDSIDTGSDSQARNGYIYARNDPINRLDPSGHSDVRQYVRQYIEGYITDVGFNVGLMEVAPPYNILVPVAKDFVIPVATIANGQYYLPEQRSKLNDPVEVRIREGYGFVAGAACTGAGYVFGDVVTGGLVSTFASPACTQAAYLVADVGIAAGHWVVDNFQEDFNPTSLINEDMRSQTLQERQAWCRKNGVSPCTRAAYRQRNQSTDLPAASQIVATPPLTQNSEAIGVSIFSFDGTSYNESVLPGPISWIQIPSSGSLASGSTVHITAPVAGNDLDPSRVQLRAVTTANVVKLSFFAYYATDPNDINTVAWRHVCWAQRVDDAWICDWDLAQVPDQGNAGWGTVAISAHYYTCEGDPGSSCDHVGDQVEVTVDRGPLTWDFGNDSQGWRLVNGSYEGFDGNLWRFEPGDDPQLVSPAFAVDAGKVNAVEVVLDSRTTNKTGKVYFTTQASGSYSEDKSVGFTLVPKADGSPRAYLVYTGGNSAWQGLITGLRVDPVTAGDSDKSDDFIAVDKISFRRLEGISSTNWVPDGSLVKGADETVYLVQKVGGQSVKRPFPSAEVFKSCGYNWNAILTLSESQLATYSDGNLMAFCSGAILKGSGPGVYFVENGQRRPFCSGDVYTGMGYRWEDIQIVPDGILEELPEGAALCTGWTKHPDGTLVKSSANSTVFLLESGKKRAFTDETVYRSWGKVFDNVVTVSDSELNSYTPGENMPFRDGAQIASDTPDVYVVENGQRRPFATAAEFEAFGYRWSNILTVPSGILNAVPLGLRIATDPLLATVGLKVTPDWPVVGQTTTASFTIRNTGNKPVTVQALRADVPGRPFPEQAASALQPGQTSSYSQVQTYATAGTYRATAQYKTGGQWVALLPGAGLSNEAGFTVMMIASPTLNTIANPEQDDVYQVAWTAVAGATSYRLEEDDDRNFGSPQQVYNGSGTSWSVSGHVAGTFHYRVKVMLPYESAWSGTQSTVVQGTPVYQGWHPDGTLMKRGSGAEVMLKENGTRRPFPNTGTYMSYYPNWEPVSTVQPVEYDQYPLGSPMTYRDGTLLKSASSGAVYVTSGNQKRAFCSASTYLALGLSWDAIHTVPDAELPAENGPMICLKDIRFNWALIKAGDNGQVYRVENGYKRPFYSTNAFFSHGYDWNQIATIDDVGAYPNGPGITIRDGTVITCPCEPGGYSIVENGQRRGFVSGDAYLGHGYEWTDNMVLEATEFYSLAPGTPIEVGSPFVNGAFVKKDNEGMVYMIENGAKRPTAYLDILRSYGWGHTEGRLLIAELDAANYWRLDNLPTGAWLSFREGTLVGITPNAMIWAIEGGKRRPMLSEAAFLAIGYQRSQVLITEAASELDPIPEGPWIGLRSLLVNGALFKNTASPSTYWRIENGVRRGYGTEEIYRSWGYNWYDAATLQDGEVLSFPDTSNFIFRDGSLLKGQNSTVVYVVEHGVKRGFPSMAVFLEYGYQTDDIQVVPDWQLGLVPDGAIMEVGSPTPLSAEINGGAQSTSSPDVTVRVHATDFSSGVRFVQLSNDNWTHTTVKDLAPAEGDFWRNVAWNLTTDAPGDGLKSVWVKFCDAQNYCSASLPPTQIWLTTPPPTGAYAAPAAGALVRDETTLQINVTDTGAGIRYVEFTATYGGTAHTLNRDYVAPYQFTWNLTAVPDQANIVLGGSVVDNLGRTGTVATRAITKDRTAPASTGLATESAVSAAQAAILASTAGVAAADNVHLSSEYVRDSVTLSLDAADNLTGVGTVQFSGYYGGAWHTIGTDAAAPYELSWNLAGLADGPLSVKATVPDLAGNSQSLPEVRVVKDTVAPAQASGLRLANRSGAFTNETSPAFVWTAATDDRSGVAGYFLAIGDPTPDGGGPNDWTIGAVTTWAISTTLTDGAYRVALTTFDRAGNVNPPDTDHPGDAPHFDFVVDTAPPSSAVQPLAAEQADRRFTVTWTGSDNISGVTGYDIQFREGPGPWLNWLVDVTDTNAIFTGEYDRQYAFRARAHDSAGNIEAYGEIPDATTRTPMPQPPAPVTDLRINMEGTVPLLRWQHSDGAALRYEIWRGASPYFVPGVAGSGAIRLRTIPAPALGVTVEFTDTAVPSDGESYYYTVVAVNAAGVRSDAPARVGLFRFSLTPGQ